ncbi:hypothetical protein FO519_008770 [Halicephalobus sp. NKZ332]|nr:hypothetical protein FO519_008770 [Halicephalobus sp. NKZ332]
MAQSEFSQKVHQGAGGPWGTAFNGGPFKGTLTGGGIGCWIALLGGVRTRRGAEGRTGRLIVLGEGRNRRGAGGGARNRRGAGDRKLRWMTLLGGARNRRGAGGRTLRWMNLLGGGGGAGMKTGARTGGAEAGIKIGARAGGAGAGIKTGTNGGGGPKDHGGGNLPQHLG